MKRRKIVAGNWKMNLQLEDAAAWMAEIGDKVEETACDVVLFPSFVLLPDLMDLYQGEKILFGAQNCSHLESGAYTGEVSAGQLASIGVDYVLAGHSERRDHFNETNEVIQAKLVQALKEGLVPIFCCGEPLHVRNQGEQERYVLKQLEETLFEFSAAQLNEIVIAYEPIWAIGTGLNASALQAQEMHRFIRGTIRNRYSAAVADAIPILYGGSCKPENASELFASPDVDGGLIGGASLKSSDFLKIVYAAQ